MNKEKAKQNSRVRRHMRVRAKVFGVAEYPRLCVSKSLKGVYLQIIDDVKRETLVSQIDKGFKGTRTERAKQAGAAIADKAGKEGVKKVVFDRGAFKYHGVIKAAAEGAREGGLIF